MDEEAEAEPVAAEQDGEGPAEQPVKKKTRRGSRGGRRRKKKPATAAEANGGAAQPDEGNGRVEEAPKIHLPDPGLGREEPVESEAPAAEANGDQPAPQKKKTRRGSRGGRRRRKPAGAQAGDTPVDPA